MVSKVDGRLPKKLSLRSNQARYAALGFAAGCLAPLVGVLVQIRAYGLPVSAAGARQALQSSPVLWLIATTPVVLGLLAALMGKRQDRLQELKAHLEQVIERRTGELEREIAASRSQEAEHRRARTYFEALVLNNPVAIATLDFEGNIVSINPAFTHLFGFGEQEAVGQSLDALLAPGFLHGEARGYTDLVSSGKVARAETHRARKDGTLVEVELQGVPVTVDGVQVGVLALYHDLTERRRAQAEVERQRQYWETLVQNSPVAIVTLDPEGRITSCNPAFEVLFGYPSSQALGQTLDDLLVDPEDQPDAKTYTRRSLEGGLVHQLATRRRSDGSMVDVELFGLPVTVNGILVGAMGLYHDISELVRARREAEQADQAKSEFLANMSHEIRTPMNGVMGMIELALDTSLTPEQADFLRTAHESAEALLSLLNDILDFSKIEAGQLELEEIAFDLHTMIEGVTETLAARAESKGLELACSFPQDLPVHVRGDPGRLRQVLVNLVGNAIKFTDKGEVVVRAEVEDQKDDLTRLRFSVSDTGIGISADQTSRLFQRFVQADGSTTRKYGGTGLGLAISRQLVEKMGGEMGVESEVGRGSTFWFSVPVRREERPVLTPLAHRDDLKGLRVLIVDDNSTSRAILRRVLAGQGCRPDEACDGTDALDRLRRAAEQGDPFRVALLDMQMPDMDGEATALAVKKDPAIRETILVILTSMGMRGDASRLEAIGVSGYLLKPLRQGQITEVMLAVLGVGAARVSEALPRLVTRHTLAERRATRILLAEDNPINRKLAVTMLTRAGYPVDTVENGRQALEALRREHYRLVLMDVQMPDMDGFEATRAIRLEEGERTHTPIIAMTAHAMKGDRERCLAAGMDDYLSKPLHSRDLFAAIERSSGNAPRPAVEAVEPAAAPSGPPLDRQAAMPYFGGDESLFHDLLVQFMGNLPGEIARLHALQADGDAPAFARQAHSIKGMAATFCAERMRHTAQQLEALGFDENLESADPLLDALESDRQQLQAYVAETGLA